ncbi:hypothetical protein GCM10017557_00820 [Streptomyces aurantiacus]|uniref:Uncharacterized protein n=1 Tax=Streptomyces aurantiacus TaxID=47760 RepID=A0A7G1NPT1_9ACTN|nr:hypothetical protein GCM10017557_00820 [Streptomyces aurantiacus]
MGMGMGFTVPRFLARNLGTVNPSTKTEPEPKYMVAHRAVSARRSGVTLQVDAASSGPRGAELGEQDLDTVGLMSRA